MDKSVQHSTIETLAMMELLQNVMRRCNAAQRRNTEESLQGTTREVVPLTQEHIPRIIEGVVKSLADINF